MKEWFLECLMIIAYSKRTQWAFVLGILGFVAIHIWGDYQMQNFQLSGPLASYTELIKDKLLRRYDKVALGCLISFWALAVKLYFRDKKRFYKFY